MGEDEPLPITEYVLSLRREAYKVSRGERHRLSAPPCRKVFVNKHDSGKPLPFWQVVSRGVYGGVDILYTVPMPCLLVNTTDVIYSEACKYSIREASSNVLIEEDCGTGTRHLYAYPRNVWDELYRFYIKPMTEGRDPYNVGVILMGPPGTGKSRLAKIVARYAGVNLFTYDASMLSKWVGESEGKLKELLHDARESQPSIIILDDAEWILVARNLAGVEAEGLAGVRLNLQQLLFQAMQEIYDSKERVLFIATTNVKQDILDPALIRHGRFGPPIFVPLPDLEAAKYIIKEALPDRNEKEIEQLAFTAVNAGLSIADVLALAERVRRGGEPRPKTVGGRGYARIYVERVKEWRSIEEKHQIPLRSILSGRRSRLLVHGPEDLAAAFAVQLVYAAGKTVIKLIDTRYLDEAIHSANMLGSVFMVPSRLPPEIQYYIHDNADVPVIWIGETAPVIPVYPLGSTIYLIRQVGVGPSLRAVAAYYNLEVTEKTIRMVEKKAKGNYDLAQRILMIVVTTGVLEEEYFEKMIAWYSPR